MEIKLEKAKELIKEEPIKVGQTITLDGVNMRGDAKVWTLVVKTINYANYDERYSSAPDMTFTSGHRFSGDCLQTQRYTNVGRYFTEIASTTNQKG